MCEVCTEAVHSVALWTRGYITTLDMCEVCTEAVHSVELWTRVTLQLWTCVKYVGKQSIPWHFEHRLQYNFGHVWSMYMQSIPKHFQHGLHYNLGHVWSMHRSSPLCSTLNTGYITSLDMCEVCTEAVHSVALWTRGCITTLDMCEVCTEAGHSVELWTRVTLQLWTCVK